MQAIVTKCLCPTNYRVARVKASCEAGSITIPWDHAHNEYGNHALACVALLAKLDWHMDTHGYYMPGSVDTDYVWVSNLSAGVHSESEVKP